MDIRWQLRMLRVHWISVILLILVGGAAGYGWALLQPKVYTADASGYVSAGTKTDTGTSLVGDNLAKSKVKTYLDLGKQRVVAEDAIKQLGLKDSPESLVSAVTITNPTDTTILKVSANASTPEKARDLAGAWVKAIANQVAVLETGEANPEASTGGVRLISLDSAVLPSTPSSPNDRLAVVVGCLFGLVLALIYVAIRSVFDRKIRSVKTVQDEFHVTVLGAIPVSKEAADDKRQLFADPSAVTSHRDWNQQAEAFREIRTNIRFMDVDHPPRIIVVTSPLPGDGKTTVAANIALTMALAQQKVVLVDGDLRRPKVAEAFGLLGSVGLTDVLVDRVEVEDVMQSWHDSEYLMVLTAGQAPPNPSELLGSDRMHSLLTKLAEDAVVIVDAPPLIPVTDAAILAARTDGAIVVGSVGRTTIDLLDRALQVLDKVKGRALGVILNRVPLKGSGAAYYGYQYRGDYAAAPTPTTQPDAVQPDAAQAVPGLAAAPPVPAQSGPVPSVLPADSAGFDEVDQTAPEASLTGARRVRRKAGRW